MSFYAVKKLCTSSTSHSFDTYLAEFFPASLTDIEKEFIKKLSASLRSSHMAYASQEENVIQSLREKKILGGPGHLLIEENGLIYFPKLYALETRLIRALLPRLVSAPLVGKLCLEGLNQEQADAVRLAQQNRFVVVTGGPGTGKTFTAFHIAKAITAAMPAARVLVVAPTGKAAARLASQIDCIESGTLHHVMGLYPGKNPRVEKKLVADLVLVDESSMIDAQMFTLFLEALPEQARVVLLGDQDQLPSIGVGSFFADLVACPFIPKVRLCQSLRVENQSLKNLADAVQKGVLEEALLQEHLAPLASLASLFEQTQHKFASGLDFKALEKFCILSFLRQGALGADSINQYFAERFSQMKRTFLPIIATKNARDLAISNGDLGFLQRENGLATLHFPNQTVQALFFPHYEYAFAISVHKSQGSEFEEVWLLAAPGSEIFGRKALYTGITRAKKSLKLLGDQEVFWKLAQLTDERVSGLAARLGSSSLCGGSINVSSRGSFS